MICPSWSRRRPLSTLRRRAGNDRGVGVWSKGRSILRWVGWKPPLGCTGSSSPVGPTRLGLRVIAVHIRHRRHWKAALSKRKAVAGDKDVGVGAVGIVQQCIKAGLDEQTRRPGARPPWGWCLIVRRSGDRTRSTWRGRVNRRHRGHASHLPHHQVKRPLGTRPRARSATWRRTASASGPTPYAHRGMLASTSRHSTVDKARATQPGGHDHERHHDRERRACSAVRIRSS